MDILLLWYRNVMYAIEQRCAVCLPAQLLAARCTFTSYQTAYMYCDFSVFPAWQVTSGRSIQ